MSFLIHNTLFDIIFLGAVILAFLIQHLNQRISSISWLLTCFLLYFAFKKLRNHLRLYLHDIQSPLAHLRLEQNGATEQFESMTQSLAGKNHIKKVDLSEHIATEVKIINSEYPHLNFTINCDQSIYVSIDPVAFNRVLSNLVNNSVEAGATQISLVITLIDRSAMVTISHNGIPYHTASRMGQGLKSAYKFAREHSGRFSIDASGLSLTLPLHIEKAILIDDDPFIRKLWLTSTRDKPISLKTLTSYQEFSPRAFNKDVTIYIDSILADEMGESVAFKLFTQGYKNIYLTTGKELTIKYPWIKGVINKTPPWLTISQET